MIKFSKYIFYPLITIILLLILIPCSSRQVNAAESGTCGDSIYWELNEWGTLYIYGYGDMPDFSPEEPAPWTEYLPENFVTVNISSDVTSVGAYAFYGYTGGLTVDMQDSAVMSIGDYAFYDCQNLQTIYLPESIFSIGQYAFYQCSSLQEIHSLDLLTSVGDYAFYYCYSLTTFPFGSSSLTTIGDYAFTECCSFDTITFAPSITYIGNSAFAASSLRSVTFEGSAPEIHSDAFNSTCIDIYYDPNTDGWSEIINQNLYGDISWHAIGGSGESTLAVGTCGDNLTWTLTQDGVMTISGIGRMYEYYGSDIPWYSFADRIQAVVVENGVTSISREAFYGCTQLSQIYVDSSVYGIGVRAFDQTPWLSSQPEGLVYIGKVLYTYKGTCPAVVSLAYDTTGIAAMAFDDVQTLEQITLPSGVVEIGGWAFRNCTSLKTIHFNEGLRNIGNSAFTGCGGLTEIIIPDSVTLLESGAFGACTAATRLVIGDGLTALSTSAFYGCSALKEISFGNNLRTISNTAFTNCTALEQVILPSSVAYIYDKAFQGCTALQKIVMPNVSHIYYYAFSSCVSLQQIEFPETLKLIDDGAFNNCTSLNAIKIPNSVTSLGVGCFASCSALTTVEIGRGVSRIDSQTFLNCTALTAIHVDPENEYYQSDEYSVLHTKDMRTLILYPVGRIGGYTVADTVTLIRTAAFANCPGLTFVTLPDGLKTLEYGVFAECVNLKEVTIPDSVTTTYGGTFIRCTSLESVWLGDGLKEITATMFLDCTALKEIRLPKFLESIGGSAFENCNNLKNLDFPQTLQLINFQAFYKCSSLEALYLPDSLTTIEYSAFQNCTALATVILPNNLKTISDNLFYYCRSLKTIVIPVSVQKINAYAFAGCSALATIKYIGSQEQWNSITKGTSAIPSKTKYAYQYQLYGNVESYGVTLQDNISIRFLMNFSEEILADSQAYLTAVFDGETQILTISEAIKGFSVEMSAAQMIMPVDISISFRQGSTGETMTYTVQQYAQYVINGSYDAQTKQLAAAMLNYGGKAQCFFAYNTDNLADDGVLVENHPLPTLENSKIKISGKIDGLSFYGASLSYRNKLAIRYYFDADNLPDDLQFSDGNTTFQPIQKDGLYYIEIANILPQDLDKSVTIQVTNSQGKMLTISYSPMDYVIRMHQKGSESAQALLQALYTYHIAAKNYTAI